MTMPSATDATSSTPSSSSTLSATQASQLSNPQLFLQLLIAELQNQDPTSPMDPSQILQQTSELSQVEAVQSMTSAITSEQASTTNSEASGLIGATVTATVSGAPVSGTVTAVNLSSSGTPTLVVSGQGDPIDLSDVTQVS